MNHQVGDVLCAVDERGEAKRTIAIEALDLGDLLEREVQVLSGGELQRFAAACTVLKDADVYMFDELSSFLDVKQRLSGTELIRSLLTPQWWGNAGDSPDQANEAACKAASKYVIVVEHDLAVLDYMSDFVCCLYGEPGAYGVVTARSSVRNGINQFLSGFITTENMRFRDHALTFKVQSVELGETGTAYDGDSADKDKDKDKEGKEGPRDKGVTHYPAMTKTHVSKTDGSSFTLHVEPGSFRSNEIIGLMGENGLLDFRYHHITYEGLIRTGKGISEPKFTKANKLRLHERWQWTSGDRSSGTSILEEI